jgi:hypothetical protein
MTVQNSSAASEGPVEVSEKLSDRLRREAFDAVDWNGETMKQWDKIRHACETLPGSDLPRLMFENLVEHLAELITESANEIDRISVCAAATAGPHDLLTEIIAHLGASIIQSVPADDQIIMDHVRAAHELAKAARHQLSKVLA